MRKGKRIVVAAMNMQQKAMAFPVQLTGFGRPSTDLRSTKLNMKMAGDKMMENLSRRQIELANKAAEAEQRKAGPAKPRGQPAANGERLEETSLRRRRHKRQSALIYIDLTFKVVLE